MDYLRGINKNKTKEENIKAGLGLGLDGEMKFDKISKYLGFIMNLLFMCVGPIS